MRTYSDFDEKIVLCNRLVDDAHLMHAEVMQDYEHYCEMKQREESDESEEYWRDAKNNEIARQWENAE